MENITINTSFDENYNLIIAFEAKDPIMIETAGDIDLTEYVKMLTQLIDKRPKLILSLQETENPKLELIQKTIYDITTSFNKIVNVVEEEKTK